MKIFLNIAQIIVSLLLVVLVLFTTKEGWTGNSLAAPQTKRGAEKVLFYLTIAIIVIFAILSLAQLYFFAR